MVIELAGLPGAGKSSIVRAMGIAHVGRGDAPLWRAPLDFKVARATLWLVLSTRPLTVKRFTRVAGLVVFLRHYRRRETLPVVIDQGLAQKIWSMLIEARSYSPLHLENLVISLAPYAADQLVWIEVATPVAADRIASRVAGNSRFDGRPAEETSARLEGFVELYGKIIALFEKHARSKVLRLRGEDPVAENAARIVRLVQGGAARGP